jgi:acetoin utilization deacetylase AcuC-like enzyme
VRAFYSDQFRLPLPEGHSFPMAKYTRLRERLIADAVVDLAELRVPRAACWNELALVHAPEYLTAVASGTLAPDAQRRIGFPWSHAMVERSRRSVGATIEAAYAALEDGVGVNLAGGTHHAFADRGEGYCVFNDVAVAARVLLDRGALERVAVIDADVHQGNGTARVFEDTPQVFTCSLHGEKNFPFHKEQSDLDVTFPDGAGDDEYLPTLAATVDEVLARHQPDLVFYLAGADPYEHDRFGRLKLTIEGLHERDRLVFDACRAAAVPVAVTMAGGYARDIEAIVTIHANTVAEARRLSSGDGVHAWL